MRTRGQARHQSETQAKSNKGAARERQSQRSRGGPGGWVRGGSGEGLRTGGPEKFTHRGGNAPCKDSYVYYGLSSFPLRVGVPACGERKGVLW